MSIKYYASDLTDKQWRPIAPHMPSEFPPCSTVHRYFSTWRDDGTLDEISRVLPEKIR